MTLDYLITSTIIVLLPGTGVIYTLAHGLGRGFRASALAAVGCTLGIVPHLVASILGLAALLHASALAFQAIKYAGVAYLFYMAWNILKDDSTFQVDEERAPAPPLRIIRNGILLNILNPKLSIFFLAFLPQFVSPAAHAGKWATTLEMLGLAGVFMGLTFAIFLLYGAFAAAARTYIISRPAVTRWLKRTFAGAFAALGLKLAFSD